MKKLKLAFVMSLVLLNSITAQARDVYGNDNYFIMVSPNAAKTSVSFQLCPLAKKARCKALGHMKSDGSPKFYSLKKLQNQRTWEKVGVGTAIAGDVIVAVGAFYGGSLVVGASVMSAVESVGLSMSLNNALTAGLIISEGAAGTLMAATDFLNPVEQYREATILNDRVLNDLPVRLDASVLKYANSLDTVLKKL